MRSHVQKETAKQSSVRLMQIPVSSLVTVEDVVWNATEIAVSRFVTVEDVVWNATEIAVISIASKATAIYNVRVMMECRAHRAVEPTAP